MFSLKNKIPMYIKDFIYFESKILELDYNGKLDDAKLEESSLGMANMIIAIGSSIESISKELHQYLYEQDSRIFPAYTAREHFDYHACIALDSNLALSEKKLEFKHDFIHSNKHQQIQPLKYAHLGDENIEKLINAKKLPLDAKRPEWCQVYPRLRHARSNNTECGTVFNALEALGALFILLTFAQYLANTSLPLSYDTAPKLQEYSVLEPIFSSHIFKPTTCRLLIDDFMNDINNNNLENLAHLPEAMFVIKDSLDLIQKVRSHQIESDLFVKIILSNDDDFCNYIKNITDSDKKKTLPILIHTYANDVKHDPEWGKKLNNILFSSSCGYTTLSANSFSENQVNNSKLWPKIFLNIFCYKEVNTITDKNNKKIYYTSEEIKYRDIYNYSSINKISQESVLQQIKQFISNIK